MPMDRVKLSNAVAQICMAAKTIDSSNLHPTVPFSAFHEALVYGDVTMVTKILDSLSDPTVTRLILNSLVVYDTSHLEKTGNKKKRCQLLFELPLALAACSGKKDLVKILIEKGTSVLQQDSNGCTIIHNLVALSEKFPEQACCMYDVLLTGIQDRQERKQLLNTENNDKLMAIDLAAELCLPEIMLRILNSDGVYKFEMGTCGPYKQITYKLPPVKDYQLLILNKIAQVPKQLLARYAKTQLLTSEPIRSMIEQYEHSSTKFMFFWVVSTITVMVLYLGYLGLYLNRTPGMFPPVAYTWLLLLTIIATLVDEIKFVIDSTPRIKTNRRSVKQGRAPFVQPFTQRMYQTFFWLCTLVICIMDLLQLSCETFGIVRVILHAFTSTLAILSLLFFLQLHENLAYFLIIINKMYLQLAQFMCVGGFFYIGFSIFFFVLETPHKCPSNYGNSTSLTPTNNSALSLANLLVDTMYNIVLLVMGLKLPDDIYFTSSQIPLLSI